MKGLVGEAAVVHSVWELLLQLQIVQREPVAVVGCALAVRGLAVGGCSEVGADPGGQPCASAGALGQQRPVQSPKRRVDIVEVVAPVCREETVREETVRDSDLVDGQPGVALQVGTLPGRPRSRCPSRLPSCSCPRRLWSSFSLGSHQFGERWVAGLLQMFSHLALISVELANSFWPRKLSAAPIGFFFQCETLFKAHVEHLALWLQIVDEEEAIGLPGRLLVDPVQLVLRQQGAELFAASSSREIAD